MLSSRYSDTSYLPGNSSQYHRRQHGEEHQAFWDEAEVPDASRGQDLVQAPSAWLMGPPGLLALAQLGVEAPSCDQQDDVADGPEEAEEAEAWDDQIPERQVAELCKKQWNHIIIYEQNAEKVGTLRKTRRESKHDEHQIS